ncbi:2Fe-2S iron-sulfur cluster binding domain-containing protein [Ramlibacter sp. AW1]|uniref:2Fe-2S iron-sulfur cluster binding domain-containing protein n=1 Tax=Ramlibacter aurantiacus TaxID=2801330 RepID=A0A936ZS40_9BURK|nr:2Fe-2S iron-sulfur cluster-binding protein [Ramlibacter aurantiacus]MBL0421541.1 2Fe-2S iron-sulfur cluster binding domain-containing protein [Ramlibacter aurantiacus]
MNTVRLHVNGREISAEAEPRTHLGDFLRDELRLTGTHLGCEHGVCGACTVLIDGQPVRSCITFAVACEGRDVTTVEGYDDDRLMQLLRAAFTRHHALQCGFCTPGMLATARDIVLRLPQADEARVRLELAGNLCRCTGYQGIVNAVLDVLQQQRDEPDAEVLRLRENLRSAPEAGPRPRVVARAEAADAVASAQVQAPSASVGIPVTTSAIGAAHQMVGQAPASAPAASPSAGASAGAKPKGNQIEAAFDVPFPLDDVWRFMGDLPAVASCLPGASIESQEGDKVKGRIAVKFGPMAAAFAGAARLERNDATKEAVLRGAGQDTLSQSRAQGDIAYRLEGISADNTRVHVDMVYSLQGPLAQFSRSGLVKDFVRRMVADFGRQVTVRMRGGDGATEPPRPIPMARMVWELLWGRLRSLFGARR